MEDQTTRIEYWKMSDLALVEAKRGMDYRAEIEQDRILNGEQIANVHTQALRDFKDIKQLIVGGLQFLKSKSINYKGIAADLGSGTGMGATILSYQPEINKVYAVEFSEQFVVRIMPEVFAQFKADETKIIRVVGDFNILEVEDESLSLILDVDSFHHSEDLDVTLKECYRVLKPGGIIIAVDRAWSDKLTPEQLEEKLDKELNDNAKKLYGVPEGESFTRRDFGEHEYTIKDWLSYYDQNGFEAFVFSQVHPPALNRIFLKIPTFAISIRIAALLSKAGLKRHLIYGFNPTRKLFVALKK